MLTKAHAYRWTKDGLSQIENVDFVERSSLVSVDRQIGLAEKNIQALVNGKPALNMLLWGGERGLGKSTIVKMLLHEYASKGLRP